MRALTLAALAGLVPVTLSDAAPPGRPASQGATSSSVPAEGGAPIATPPVSLGTIAGDTLTVRFTAVPSKAGVLLVVAAPAGRVPVFSISEPTGGSVSVLDTTVLGAPTGSPVTLQIQDAAGETLATCTFPVAASGTTSSPSACRLPGAKVTLAPAATSPSGHAPTGLPDTGKGGLQRR